MDIFEPFEREIEGYRIYSAGENVYRSNFTRDGIVSGLIAGDPKLLRSQLEFSAYKQGKEMNSRTGEEPGKFHHEYPGVNLKGDLYTDYNACETTALGLIGFEENERITGDKWFAREYRKTIERGAEYIISHTNEHGLFLEDPRWCGGDEFAIPVTYWKDSLIMDRKDGVPAYPVVYTLAHAQNRRGMVSAAMLLDSKELWKEAERMREAVQYLWDDGTGSFMVAWDKEGKIQGISSDALHSLYYLDREDLARRQVERLAASAGPLETMAGYRTAEPCLVPRCPRGYHTRTVWLYEQALISMGARKFWLPGVEEVSSRVKDVYRQLGGLNSELVIVEEPAGEEEEFEMDAEVIKVSDVTLRANMRSLLMTAAAREYFSSPENQDRTD